MGLFKYIRTYLVYIHIYICFIMNLKIPIIKRYTLYVYLYMYTHIYTYISIRKKEEKNKPYMLII